MYKAKYDVIIVGAGPAGLTAAKEIAENGFSVIVLEKNKVLGDKPCGGAVTLRNLKNFEIPLTAAEQLIECITIVFPRGIPKTVYYEEPVIANFSRIKLAEILAKKANKAGVEIRTNSLVKDIKRVENTWRVSVKPTESRIYESKVLIGADGVFSTVVRITNVRRPFGKHELGFSLQYQIKLDTGLECEEFLYGHEISPFGYGWIFPHGDIARVGVGALYSAMEHDLNDYLRSLTQKYIVDRNLANLRGIIKKEGAFVPLSGIIRPTYGKGVLIVGDAAGHVQPISGEGIAYAMRGGILAGKVISEGLKKKDLSEDFLKKYEKLWYSEFGSDLKWGRKLLEYFANRRGGKSQTSFILKDKKLVKLVADILVGYDRLSKLLIKNALRILLRKIF